MSLEASPSLHSCSLGDQEWLTFHQGCGQVLGIDDRTMWFEEGCERPVSVFFIHWATLQTMSDPSNEAGGLTFVFVLWLFFFDLF